MFKIVAVQAQPQRLKFLGKALFFYRGENKMAIGENLKVKKGAFKIHWNGRRTRLCVDSAGERHGKS
jgi:hypothetical protein